jgi:hypothetical protein
MTCGRHWLLLLLAAFLVMQNELALAWQRRKVVAQP